MSSKRLKTLCKTEDASRSRQEKSGGIPQFLTITPVCLFNIVSRQQPIVRCNLVLFPPFESFKLTKASICATSCSLSNNSALASSAQQQQRDDPSSRKSTGSTIWLIHVLHVNYKSKIIPVYQWNILNFNLGLYMMHITVLPTRRIASSYQE